MSILNHFNVMVPTTDQKNAAEKLEQFIHDDSHVFILQGYAGTGKTTLLKSLIDYLKAQQLLFSAMAPTGRAAKILRDKTGSGNTIHSAIYDFLNLESINKDSEDEADQSFHYYFPINNLDASNRQIIIVDEASMVSNKESKHELFTFGTNILLNDLLTYASLRTTKNKIIFVGDPAQLPPVGDSSSKALDTRFFEEKALVVQQAVLKEIKRQSDNLIVENAANIRNLIESKNRTLFKFNYDSSTFKKIDSNEVLSKYTELFSSPEIGDGVIISFTNQQCYQYNLAIRSRYFPNQQHVVPGDLLLINNNNYHTYGVKLFNGDIVKVINAHSDVEVQKTPVWCEEDGKKIRKIVEIQFRKLTIRAADHPEEVECFIIDSLLHSINRELSICEMKALYINFVMRFRDVQKIRQEQGLETHKVGSKEFKEALKLDPYFNALKVKFGYAITCHKAQGGEWKQVFVDYYGQVSLNTSPLRWCYTATTRAINTLFAINPPNFGVFSKLKFSSIGTIGTIPNEALFLDNVLLSPFHNENQHKAKSLKYWEVLEQIENTDFKIVNVESREYLERYSISYRDIIFSIEASHKGSGHFVDQFKISSGNIEPEQKTQILSIFNSKISSNIQPSYSPSKDFLDELYSLMQSVCEELDIKITNVIEAKNYVNYYLITDSICSYIQFYFNDKNALTTALPKSFQSEGDTKLNQLTQKILSHVV